MKSQLLQTLLFSALALGLSAFALRAQQYSIDWFKVADGSGTCTNGQYVVSGTIGQADASAGMSGGNYMFAGGFWSLLAVQTPGAPVLSIFRTSTNTVVVAWPAPSTGFVLQQKSDLSAGSWVNVTTPPVIVGNRNEVVVSPQLGKSYYRLQK